MPSTISAWLVRLRLVEAAFPRGLDDSVRNAERAAPASSIAVPRP